MNGAWTSEARGRREGGMSEALLTAHDSDGDVECQFCAKETLIVSRQGAYRNRLPNDGSTEYIKL